MGHASRFLERRVNGADGLEFGLHFSHATTSAMFHRFTDDRVHADVRSKVFLEILSRDLTVLEDSCE